MDTRTRTYGYLNFGSSIGGSRTRTRSGRAGRKIERLLPATMTGGASRLFLPYDFSLPPPAVPCPERPGMSLRFPPAVRSQQALRTQLPRSNGTGKRSVMIGAGTGVLTITSTREQGLD